MKSVWLNGKKEQLNWSRVNKLTRPHVMGWNKFNNKTNDIKRGQSMNKSY